MSESLWSLPADELLRRAASSSATPGSGAVAAISGSLGLALVLMALEISDADAKLRRRGESLLPRLTAAADRDVAAFAAVIDARGMGKDGEEERVERDRAVERATVAATEGPLDLAGLLEEGLELSELAEPLVKAELVSDVRSGAELMRAAASVAVRAARLNLGALEREGAAPADALRERLERLEAALDGRG